MDGVANSSTAHQWKTTGHHNQGHWLDVVFISRYRVDKVRLKQLNATYKQMKDVQIQFGDLTTVDVSSSKLISCNHLIYARHVSGALPFLHTPEIQKYFMYYMFL